MEKITGDFNWNKSKVYTSFVHGVDARTIYDSLEENMKKGISFNDKINTLIGSTVFASAKIDTLVRPLGIRVVNLRDLSRPEVMSMVRDKHYIDSPALVLRSMEDIYGRNLPLIKQISQEVENVNGKVELPVMITGFDVKTVKEDKGYGIVIVPREDFKAIYDERLSGSNDGKRFSGVDDLGLPEFDRTGSRMWCARDSGLSRLCLGGNFFVYSRDWCLSDSYDFGRVVLVSGKSLQKIF